MCIKKIHQRGTGRGARAVMEVFVLFRSLLIRTPPFHGVGVCRLLLFSWWTCPFRGNSNGTAYLHVINGVFSSSFQTSDLVASAACFLSFCVVQLELVFDSGTRFLSCNNVFLPNLCSASHLSSVYSITSRKSKTRQQLTVAHLASGHSSLLLDFIESARKPVDSNVCLHVNLVRKWLFVPDSGIQHPRKS